MVINTISEIISKYLILISQRKKGQNEIGDFVGTLVALIR